MTKIEYKKSAKKVLSNLKGKNLKYAVLIKNKINFCLGDHLYDIISQCNKKALKGSSTGTHRLHVQRKYTVFYTIVKKKTEVIVCINDIMGFEEAHQKYDRFL